MQHSNSHILRTFPNLSPLPPLYAHLIDAILPHKHVQKHVKRNKSLNFPCHHNTRVSPLLILTPCISPLLSPPFQDHSFLLHLENCPIFLGNVALGLTSLYSENKQRRSSLPNLYLILSLSLTHTQTHIVLPTYK
ncbi:UNVERIFIED_CONTAM: hypothetical protein K2H54_035071 [Gekko kuhli]